jgi:hypothetical protein
MQINKQFNLLEFLVSIFVGFLVSYFIGWLFSISYLISFPLGYSLTYFLLIINKNKILSFFSKEIEEQEIKKNNAYVLLEKTHKDLNKVIQYTMDMDLYDDMTEEDAKKNLKKISKDLYAIREEYLNKK